MNWDKLKSEMLLQFGSALYEDRFGELCKLKQTGSVREYQRWFKRLLAKVGVLTNKQKTACFISGLMEPLRADVRAQNLTTLSSTIALARIYEGKNQEGRNGYGEAKPNSFVKKIPVPGFKVVEGGDKGGKPNFPVRKFTPAELQKQWEHGIFFHYDERYTF